MSRLVAAVFAIACSLLPAVTWATQETTIIRSKAALTRYLHDTPAGKSPLDRLSPGGRKRFLAGLAFGDHGVSDLSLDDPAWELRHQQIVDLFALFDAQSHAQGLGVTPDRQARLARERAAEADARGCTVDSCPESAVELRYDALMLYKPEHSLSQDERFSLIGEQYDRLFAWTQSPQQLRSVSRPDLRLLKRAAEHVVFYLPTRIHLAHLQMDLTEMQRRNMAVDQDFGQLHDALLAERQFAAAVALTQQHPDLDADFVPTLEQGTALPEQWPTALTLDAHGQTMRREAFDLAAPLQIVVVASCHFSQDAARAIAADNDLRTLFQNHAIWLANQRESFGAAIAWNQKFPHQPIHIAWRNDEWPMLDTWAMPTFYVFHHGRLTGKFSGWHDVKSLKKSLHDAGALD